MSKKLPISSKLNARQKIFAGQKYHRWTILEKVETRISKAGYTKAYYLCQCDCGTKREICGNNLLYNQSFSCGCIPKENRDAKREVRNPVQYRVFATYRYYARRRKLTFNITPSELIEICKKNCFYCNGKPSNIAKGVRDTDIDFEYNGIDRVDNLIGYEKENIVPCCKHCNVAKHAMTKQEYYDLIVKSYHNLKEKGEI